MPHASLSSSGATSAFPPAVSSVVTKLLTSAMRDVLRYSSGCCLRQRMICAAVKRVCAMLPVTRASGGTSPPGPHVRSAKRISSSHSASVEASCQLGTSAREKVSAPSCSRSGAPPCARSSAERAACAKYTDACCWPAELIAAIRCTGQWCSCTMASQRRSIAATYMVTGAATASGTPSSSGCPAGSTPPLVPNSGRCSSKRTCTSSTPCRCTSSREALSACVDRSRPTNSGSALSAMSHGARSSGLRRQEDAPQARV